MTLEEHLERLAGRTRPGDPAEVLAEARSRLASARPVSRRRRGPLLAAATISVVAVGVGALALTRGDSPTELVAGDGGGGGSPACEDVTRFADSLDDTGIVYDYNPSASARDLAAQSETVFSGTLTGAATELVRGDSADAEVRRPPDRYVGFEVRVSEQHKPAGGGPGVVTVLLAHGAEQTGRWADLAEAAAGAPLVVFADAPTVMPGTDGPSVRVGVEGIVTACAGGRPLGLVGSTGEWPSYATLEEVVRAVRGAT